MPSTDKIKNDKPARLFPSLKRSNRERIAVSILLASFRVIPELLSELINDIGIRMSSKKLPETFREVELAQQLPEQNSQPDGFIYVRNRATWQALVEAKLGANKLDEEQTTRYLKLAKLNNIDALITISNEFTPRVEQSPLTLPKKLTKKVKLYHFSWRLILTKALLMKNQKKLKSAEQQFVLDELIRFLKDDNTGVAGFAQMPPSWKDVCGKVGVGNRINQSDASVVEVAKSLVEEFSEIALIISDHLGVNCTVKLPRKFTTQEKLWQDQVASIIAKSEPIICSYLIPDAAGELKVKIDIKSSTMEVGMEIEAPQDKGAKACISWLAKQITGSNNDNDFVRVRWKSNVQDDVIKVSDLQADFVKNLSRSSKIRSFTPFVQVQSTRTFKANRKFIQELEHLVVRYYDDYAQHLKKWVAKAPAPIKQNDE